MSTETLTMRARHEEIVITPRVRGYSVRRYYDPQTGQFISIDPAVDQTERPYLYAADDPVDSSDPSGMDVCVFGHCVYTPSLQDVGDWSAGFGDTVTFGGTMQVRRLINYWATGDTSDFGVNHCSDFYRWGGIGGDFANVFDSIVVPGTIIKWLGPGAPIVGRGGILFGRSRFGTRGIFNRTFIRVGWGWDGTQEVFRLSIGGPGRRSIFGNPIWKHFDLFSG